MSDRRHSTAGRRGSRGTTVIAFACVLIALGLAERGVRALVSRRLPTAGAEWIWARGALESSQSLAFFAVRDVELDAAPEKARVHVLADEAYILYVNGRRIGSGAWFARAPLDTYVLDGLLRPGWNRVVVELRSVRGAGGLLLAVVADGARAPVVATGEDWRTFRDAAGVVEGTRRFDEGEPARVWQSPPTGGWGVPRLGSERPTFDAAVALTGGGLDPLLIEAREAGTRQAASDGAPRRTLDDFGRPVSGYLVLRGLAAAPRRLRIEIGIEAHPTASVDVLLAEGQNEWSASEARSLRYVEWPFPIEGASAGLLAVEPELAARDADRAARRRVGVFGVEGGSLPAGASL